jgi:hypothetical protein
MFQAKAFCREVIEWLNGYNGIFSSDLVDEKQLSTPAPGTITNTTTSTTISDTSMCSTAFTNDGTQSLKFVVP